MKKIHTLKYLLIAVCAISITACNKDKADNNDSTPTDAVTAPSVTETAGDKTPVPITPMATKEPEVTDVPDVTKVPDEPVDNVSYQNALSTLYSIIPESKYDIELEAENVTIDGRRYYVFKVLQGNEVINPMVIVDKGDASVHYYEGNGKIVEFTHFPLDKVEIIEPNQDIKEDDIIERIASLTQEESGLDKPFEQYETETDAWTTMVNGESCYSINLFDTSGGNRQLAAVFYVSADGDNIYRLEEDNSFILVK